MADRRRYCGRTATARRHQRVLADGGNGAACGAPDAVREDPAASPSPPAPKPLDCEIGEREVIIHFGGPSGRRYRIRGHDKNPTPSTLKVSILASRDAAIHADSLDLYSARARQAFVKTAAVELSVSEDAIKKDVGRVLLKLEELQERALAAATAPPEAGADMSDQERAEALALLESPDLLAKILADFDACVVVGERTNKLVGYLAATSRLLDKPLAIVVQSNSAAGKSSLMDAVLDLMPDEAQIKSSMLTGQSLYYMGERDIKHKILAIAEDEGISRAAFALKLLQSDGEVSITTVVKDPDSGEHRTKTYKAEGPAMLMLTTTALEVDEELLNRCMVLTVDEDRAQTQAIHARQRSAETLDGLLCRQQRRDHLKYLTLIRSVALLHQVQREMKTIDPGGRGGGADNGHPLTGGHPVTYIEATLDDIAIANRLAHGILGRTLDELPPQTRRVLRTVVTIVYEACERQEMARSAYRFTRRELRVAMGQSDTRLKLHLARLVDLEYLRIERADYGRYRYELLYDGGGGPGPHLIGLIDVETLGYDGNRSGVDGDRSAPGRGVVGIEKPAPSPMAWVFAAMRSETTPKTPQGAAMHKARRT